MSEVGMSPSQHEENSLKMSPDTGHNDREERSASGEHERRPQIESRSASDSVLHPEAMVSLGRPTVDVQQHLQSTPVNPMIVTSPNSPTIGPKDTSQLPSPSSIKRPGSALSSEPNGSGLLSPSPTPSATQARPRRPVLQRFYSLPEAPTNSPARHHLRLPNAGPREVKETPSITYAEDARGKSINQYLVQSEAGRGTYGMVYKTIDTATNTLYAIKEYSKMQVIKAHRQQIMHMRRKGQAWSGKASDLIREEVAIMKRIDHPNLVNLNEVLDDEKTDRLYMVMEWCENGTIMPPESEYDGKATPLDEEQSRLYFRDMILGVEYLHAQGIAHRDIKADNVLLGEDDVLKIADFGVSEMFDTPEEDTVRKYAGSPAYGAPELAVLCGGTGNTLNAEERKNLSGRKTDIWAMGVTLYYMHHGWLPFQADSLTDLYMSIVSQDVVVKQDTSPELADLFSKLLQKDPKSRITMAELRDHPWVTQNGSDKLLSYEENVSTISGPITEHHLRSAIEKLSQTYAEPFDWQAASLSLRRDYGWRGAVSTNETSPEPSPNEEPQDNMLVDKLTLALDEILRKMRWNSSS